MVNIADIGLTVMRVVLSFSALVGESFGGGSVSFHENRDVNGTVWEQLEKLKNGEVLTTV